MIKESQKYYAIFLGIFSSVFILFTVIAFADVPTPKDDGREQLINRELNSAARRLERQQLPLEDTVSSSPDVVLPVENPPIDDSNFEALYSQKSFDEYKKSPHQFEIETESYYYKYKETIGVKVTGMKGGLIGAYQFRLHENDAFNFTEIFKDFEKMMNIFRLEGRFSYGQVEYEGSGSEGGIPDWNFETRALLGSEVLLPNKLQLTPYLGVGYRYLLNEFSETPSKIIGGTLYGSGYDRESNYVYIPIGIEIKREFQQNWIASFKAEYDYFIWGKQISHLEDITVNGLTDPGLDKLSNTQDHGRGWRASARLTHRTDRFDYYIEPFFRYWHIKDSDVEFITASGAYICQGNLCAAGAEPENETYEAGVNLGANF